MIKHLQCLGFGYQRDMRAKKNIAFSEQKSEKQRLEKGSGSTADQRRRGSQIDSKFYASEREKIVRGADIILCTLNSAGLPWLNELLSSTKRPILCVIVDEACQAKEVETLIPLRWATNKLVLVGDPCQLPPTVLSSVKSFSMFWLPVYP